MNEPRQMMEIEARIKGRRIRISDSEVRSRLRGVQPEVTYIYVVYVDGVVFPVKQAFSVVTGLQRSDFITDHARRAFERLGFMARRRGSGPSST